MATETAQTTTRAGTAPLQVLRPANRDCGTTQTPGMQREAGVSLETTGAEQLWMGHVTVAPGVESGVHHHGACESGIYIISGQARSVRDRTCRSKRTPAPATSSLSPRGHCIRRSI